MQIDRHLAERRHKQKKRRGYFWSVVGFLAVYFVALGIFYFIVLSPAFQVKKITIDGASAVPTSTIMNLLQASVIRANDSPFGKNSGSKAMLGFNNMLIWPDALSASAVATIPQLAGVTISKDYFFHTITVTVTERAPFAVWCATPHSESGSENTVGQAGSNDPDANEQCYWFDNQGIAFAPTLDTQGNAIMIVHDYAPTSALTLGGAVLSPEFMPNLISIINALKASNLDIQEIALNDFSLQQIDVTTVNGPAIYFSLRFSANEDLSILQSLIAAPNFDRLQYIDFTVQNRAYYK